MATTEAVTGELVRAQPLLPMPVYEAAAAMAAYQELTGKLLTDNDWQTAGPDRSFVKRSGWSKLATFYGVSTRIVKDDVARDENGTIVRASMIVRATHPNGRSEEGDGACSIDEPRFANPRGRRNAEHDVRGTARTRARNRAIADLIGFGQVSAEEMMAPDSSVPLELPAWAKPLPDPSMIVPQLAKILQAAGVDKPGEAINNIGQAVMDACDGTIPMCVHDLLADLVAYLPTPAPTEPTEPAAPESDPAPETEQEETP